MAADLRLLRRRLGVHGINGPLRILLHGAVAQPDAAAVLFQAGNDRILPDIQDGENTGRAALLRQQGKAVFDGLARIAVAAGLAVEGD